MKKGILIKIVILIMALVLLVSCTQMGEILERAVNYGPLSSSEVSMGLKEALTIGTKIAVSGLSTEDGFLLDEAVKILLPSEAAKAVKLIIKIPGGKKLIDDLVLRLNRAAEFAVTKAVPIFVDAITSLTIKDAFDILRGNDTAATQYLHGRTFNSLYSLFKPEVKKSLDKRLIGNLSTSRSWELFTNKYNSVARSIAGKLTGIKPLHHKLDEYVTGRALDALFLKLSGEEKKIRESPIARTTVLLRRVFGSVNR
ncbi:MAG: DUF4197 domain-containing protein [Candidatus Aminicenantes bacterium]|nr:DUF4197 domain-containing protein [Candidatus Aminicenantes bacterium]